MAQRVPVPRFVGGSLQLLSRQEADERSINFMPETTGGGGKAARILKPTETVYPLLKITGQSDGNALFSQDGATYGMVGTKAIQINPLTPSATILGTVAAPARRGSIVSNGSAGHQVVFNSGGIVYVWDTNALTFVTVTDLTGINIDQLEFMDGYVFARVRNTRRVYFSALEDATSFDTTFDYFERSWGSDNIARIVRSGRQLWVLGTRTSEVWADAGNATNPWAPIQGAFLDVGSIGTQNAVRDGDTVTFVTQDERGGGAVVRATGYNPEEQSHYGIAAKLQGLALPQNLETCEGTMMQINGHPLYWLYVPGLDTNLVFDFKEKEWHERALWDKTAAAWVRHPIRSHCYANERHLIGVRDTGYIYVLSAGRPFDVWFV